MEDGRDGRDEKEVVNCWIMSSSDYSLAVASFPKSDSNGKVGKSVAIRKNVYEFQGYRCPDLGDKACRTNVGISIN